MDLSLTAMEAGIITFLIQIIMPFIRKKVDQKWLSLIVLGIALVAEAALVLIKGFSVQDLLVALGTSGVNAQIYKIAKDQAAGNPS